jgi:hypothetical protein
MKYGGGVVIIRKRCRRHRKLKEKKTIIIRYRGPVVT